MPRAPRASVDPMASIKKFEALARSAMASLEIRAEFEMDAHTTSTGAHGYWRAPSRREERLIKCASQKSGSMANTNPARPERAAAQRLNSPTLAPTSHTTEPGFTSSSAMLYSTGSTRDMADQ